jgi:hypothetical protein
MFQRPISTLGEASVLPNLIETSHNYDPSLKQCQEIFQQCLTKLMLIFTYIIWIALSEDNFH